MAASTTPTHLDALIVGAGPVGLTMAAELRRHGLTCRIIDKAPTATDKSKALVVWTRTLEHLENMGLAEKFVDAGMLLDGATIHADGEPKIHLTMDVQHTRFPRPLMIPQSKTEALLAEHLRMHGVQVERSTELLHFSEQAEHVEAVLKRADGTEEAVTASWLLGCDGAHSTVRHQLQMEFSGSAEPNDWLLADVHVRSGLPAAEISIFWHALGILVFFPFESGRYRVIADIGFAKDLSKPADPTLADVQRVVNERGPEGVELYDPIWLAGFRINERKVANYRAGRVFLSGDAAHIHSPAGGQGMNTGMQDAVNLAWKLALVQKGRGLAAPLLDSYSEERSAVGDTVLRAAGMLTRVATLRNPISQFVRNHTASMLGSFSIFRQRATNALTELAVNYPHSPLSSEHHALHVLSWLTGGIKPGERVPDAILVAAKNGALERLSTLLHGTEHHLFYFIGKSDPSAFMLLADICHQVQHKFQGLIQSHLLVPAGAIPHDQMAQVEVYDGVWLDAQRTVHGQHAIHEPALVLVRPDGYVGFRCQPASWETLLTHLRKQLVPVT